MTRALEEAFAVVARLPEDRQDELAALILEELAAEAGWDESFARSQDVLGRLAEEALAEHRGGETEEWPRKVG